MKSRKSVFFGKFDVKKKQLHIETLASLLANGFRLSEALQAMNRSGHFDRERLKEFHQKLSDGQSLAACFTSFDLSAQELSAIQLAQQHGDLVATLQHIAQQLKLVAKQRQELRKNLAYPLLLIFFVLSLLIGLRQFLVPQLLASGMMAADHWGVRFLQKGPLILLFLMVVTAGMFGFCFWQLGKWDALRRGRFWGKMPGVESLYRLFVTSYFALEWGKLFKEGLELQQIITSMLITDSRSLMYALAQELHQGLLQGQTLHDQLGKYPFLTREFAQIVFQGESKGRLGEELVMYSQLTRSTFFQRTEKMLNWIQPVVFLLIAGLIVSLYAAMFLPLYDSMGELM